MVTLHLLNKNFEWIYFVIKFIMHLCISSCPLCFTWQRSAEVNARLQNCSWKILQQIYGWKRYRSAIFRRNQYYSIMLTLTSKSCFLGWRNNSPWKIQSRQPTLCFGYSFYNYYRKIVVLKSGATCLFSWLVEHAPKRGNDRSG